MKRKRFATIEVIKEKSLLAIAKNARIGKNAGISVLHLRGVTLNGTRLVLVNK